MSVRKEEEIAQYELIHHTVFRLKKTYYIEICHYIDPALFINICMVVLITVGSLQDCVSSSSELHLRWERKEKYPTVREIIRVTMSFLFTSDVATLEKQQSLAVELHCCSSLLIPLFKLWYWLTKH